MAKQNYSKRRGSRKNKPTEEVDSKGKKHDKSTSKEPETFNGNDPEWYIRDTTMKTGLTRMPTFEFRGTDSAMDNVVWVDTAEGVPNIPVNTLSSPTVALHRLNPSPGAAIDQSSPINMAARMLYSKLSSSNAKTSNYAPQDVATLMLAIGEVISMITHYTRLYGITQFYNKMNRAIPDAFLKAYGIRVQDISEWTQYLPEFRAELNQLITVANSIAFPSNIAYFKKCAYIYQNIYIDDYSVMTGYHMMAPHSTWIIDETTFEQGTILKTRMVDSPDNIYFKAKLSTLREQINAILTSLTYNYIYSDILNLATRNVLGSDLLSFGTIPIDYIVEPILSDQFNWQLMNATIFGEPNGTLKLAGTTPEYTPNNDVYPDVNRNCLVYNPRWIATDTMWYDHFNIIEPIVRVPDVGVSEDDLLDLIAYTGNYYLELTKPSTKVSNIEGTAYITGSLGSVSIPDHYFVQSKIFYGTTSDSKTIPDINHNNLGVVGNTGSTRSNLTLIASLASEFQHFPLMYYYNLVSTVNSVYVPESLRFSSRLGAYTLKMRGAIKNVRNASFLGLFTME